VYGVRFSGCCHHERYPAPEVVREKEENGDFSDLGAAQAGIIKLTIIFTFCRKQHP